MSRVVAKFFRARQLLTDISLLLFRRHQLKNKNFSVICNNCLAGVGIYKKLRMKYSTPTIGLWFYADDYIRFLENIEWYINQPLTFTKTSKYPEVNEAQKLQKYPIGVLGWDVEIQFNHYRTEDEAKKKWERRSKRINKKNLFLIFSDRYAFKEEYLARYERLPYPKLFFSAKPRKSEVVIFVREYKNETEVGNSKINRYYEKYVDLIKWLNGEPYKK